MEKDTKAKVEQLYHTSLENIKTLEVNVREEKRRREEEIEKLITVEKNKRESEVDKHLKHISQLEEELRVNKVHV